MSVRKGCIRALGLCVFSPLVFAADVPGSQDLPAVARQVDAPLVDYRPAEEKERIYPMGAIRKLSGQLRYEAQATARGHATAITYELPAAHTSSALLANSSAASDSYVVKSKMWSDRYSSGDPSASCSHWTA